MAVNIDGVIIIDKPADWTSHDVVARARRILQTRGIGHTGTLDPFATGVLVLCVGRMTRLARFLSGEDKEYEAVMRMGSATDTGDLTGSPIPPYRHPGHVTIAEVSSVLPEFRGRRQQVPPMYAAKKIDGVRLYEMARRGEVIARKPVDIEIKELELNEQANASLPSGDIAFRVVCTAGTYIRTLAEEIGQRLGVGAHLVALRRTRAGRCLLDKAISLERLEELVNAGRLDETLQVVTSIIGLAVVELDEADETKVRHGAGIKCRRTAGSGERVMLCNGKGDVLAIAEYDEERTQWQPKAVIAG